MAIFKKAFIAIFLITCITASFKGYAWAEHNKDVYTISKALGFIQGGPSGTVEMAVVYDPSNSASVAHADDIISSTKHNIRSNKVSLDMVKVPLGALKQSPAKVIFITRGLEGSYASIFSAAQNMGAITVSTEEGCLYGNGCVMVVKSKPHVDILVNRALAMKTGTEFSSAFSMMITKK